jgi:hypothetical protein
VDPDIFEDLHISLQGLHLTEVLHRPTELWEMVQLVRAERAMVRGEIYRYDGLRDAYRAAGIATTILKRLEQVREKTGPMIRSLRDFLSKIATAPKDGETVELAIAFITISPKGREAVARWVADPPGQTADATTKLKMITNIVEEYAKTLREWHPVPPPPSSPLDKENRPQLTPRFQPLEAPLRGSLLPSKSGGEYAFAPPPAAPSLKPASVPAPAPVEVPAPVAVAVAPPPVTKPETASANPVSLILPRGVNPEILADVRRVDQCRKIFQETNQEIEVWEVFCLVMLDNDTKATLEKLLEQKQKGERQAFLDGALALFDRLLKIRAQHGKFIRDLRGYLGALPVGTFGKETMEMALGFIVASQRGRDRAQLWLTEPNRYKSEAAGRLEDVISRTMNYQTALRMVADAGA